MTITVTPVTVYAVNRLTVDVPASVAEFQQHYEQAVPAMPRERVDALVARSAPREEMLDLIQNEPRSFSTTMNEQRPDNPNGRRDSRMINMCAISGPGSRPFNGAESAIWLYASTGKECATIAAVT